MPGDEGLYRAILREFGGADLVLRPLARKMAELPGFPVLRRSEVSFAKGRALDERKLLGRGEAARRRGFRGAGRLPPGSPSTSRYG